jgi:hypothetical protein
VKDEIGKRAVITWTRQITIGITNAAQAGAVATDDKGQFTISGLVGATYALCAQIPGSTYLDPCVWNETLPQVELKTGGKVNGVKLDLVKGVRLQLEVADTDQKLSSAENKNGANLLVRVPRPHGPALDLRPISSTKGQRTYGVIVPEFVQMPVLVEGKGVSFSDESGNGRGDDRAMLTVGTQGKESQRLKVSVKGR